MTTTTTSTSRPSSPTSGTRKRKPRPIDPIQRTDTATLASFSASPTTAGDDTIWTRTITAPLAFISFLFSLSYVDWRDRARRVAQNTPSPAGGYSETVWSWLSIWNWGREPWQREDGTWDVGHGQEGKREGEYARTGSWPIRKKLRRMARLEVGDALEMRGVVSVLVLAVGLGVMVGIWLMGRWGWRKWSG
ncbi:Hypothetical protein D9617_36g062810 [Elsinoe fawcettii]|nr:Hypothetical protein D9617_36g062810 [Elsinoe fawcettii]